MIGIEDNNNNLNSGNFNLIYEATIKIKFYFLHGIMATKLGKLSSCIYCIRYLHDRTLWNINE